MRCNTCNKFVSYSDDPAIEIDTESIESNDISADITVYLTCAECGEQLKQASTSVEESLVDYHECDSTGELKEFTGEQFVITDSYGTGSQVDGKAWQSDLTFTIHCERCDSSFDYETGTTTSASEFEEI